MQLAQDCSSSLVIPRCPLPLILPACGLSSKACACCTSNIYMDRGKNSSFYYQCEGKVDNHLACTTKWVWGWSWQAFFCSYHQCTDEARRYLIAPQLWEQSRMSSVYNTNVGIELKVLIWVKSLCWRLPVCKRNGDWVEKCQFIPPSWAHGSFQLLSPHQCYKMVVFNFIRTLMVNLSAFKLHSDH